MEAFLERPDGCRLNYVIDDFTDAWGPAPTVLFVHGLVESTEAWRGWVTARGYGVVRIDPRGFGRSTPMPDDAWHAAGAYPDACAEETLRFIESHAKEAQ